MIIHLKIYITTGGKIALFLKNFQFLFITKQKMVNYF